MTTTASVQPRKLLLQSHTTFDISNITPSSNKNNQKSGRKVVQTEKWNGNGAVKNVTEHYFPAKKQKHIVMPEHTKGILRHWPKAKNIGPYYRSNLI
mmetsp:Transcript_50601/g.56544  ORF Transcript_50601/g.56544 Transcript_50601/m.56544 type:complete len:97 (-) Transcript_50601:32-322(-)